MWEVAAWAAHLPIDSATARAVDPGSQHTYDLELLRRIELWTHAAAGVKDAKPFAFPWDAPEEGAWQGDAHEWDEAADALGGDERLRRLMVVA